MFQKIWLLNSKFNPASAFLAIIFYKLCKEVAFIFIDDDNLFGTGFSQHAGFSATTGRGNTAEDPAAGIHILQRVLINDVVGNADGRDIQFLTELFFILQCLTDFKGQGAGQHSFLDLTATLGRPQFSAGPIDIKLGANRGDDGAGYVINHMFRIILVFFINCRREDKFPQPGIIAVALHNTAFIKHCHFAGIIKFLVGSCLPDDLILPLNLMFEIAPSQIHSGVQFLG